VHKGLQVAQELRVVLQEQQARKDPLEIPEVLQVPLADWAAQVPPVHKERKDQLAHRGQWDQRELQDRKVVQVELLVPQVPQVQEGLQVYKAHAVPLAIQVGKDPLVPQDLRVAQVVPQEPQVRQDKLVPQAHKDLLVLPEHQEELQEQQVHRAHLALAVQSLFTMKVVY